MLDFLTVLGLETSERAGEVVILLLVDFVVVIVLVVLLLGALSCYIFVSGCCHEAAFVAFIQDVVCEENAELISSNPGTLGHVVNVSRLNQSYIYVQTFD